MFKRIILCILTVVMAATLLCGCSFFSHNYERDYMQVAAVVDSYEIENSVFDKETDKTVIKKYTTEKKTIYKRDLVNYVNNNYSSLSQSYPDSKSLVKHAMEMLVDTELIINEVDALIDAGLIEWGQKQKNAVKQQIYSVIDGSIVTLQNNILEERDKPTISTDNEEPSASTTYPVKPVEEVDDDDDLPEPEPWAPSLSSYPGLFGDSDERSLGREAVKRFIMLLKDRVDGDFRLTADDKKKFEADDKEIDRIINEEGIEYVYGYLGDTHYVYYISGKDIERAQKIRALQTYLTDSVTVYDEEVATSYRNTLNEQMSSYSDDVSAFDSAMSGGSTTVLYYPNNNYFYVKHILLPFSDEQKADLAAYKARLNVTEDQIEAYRDMLVDGIVCYPHVAGEDDKSHPMTVDEVFNLISAKMTPLKSNVKLADVAFDDLIYLYNTDPGAFGNNKGYVVKYELDVGESETYMQEFADAARDMRDTIAVGEVYSEKVVTDYGVHIMYYASNTKAGAVDLYDYTTPGELKTYYDVLAAPIRSTRENAAYNNWEAQVLQYNFDSHATLYEKRYKDLWED